MYKDSELLFPVEIWEKGCLSRHSLFLLIQRFADCDLCFGSLFHTIAENSQNLYFPSMAHFVFSQSTTGKIQFQVAQIQQIYNPRFVRYPETHLLDNHVD